MPQESSENLENAATLVIYRNAPKDCTYRIIHLSIDEVREASLNWNESVTVKLKPGLHTITVDNTWATKRITIACHPDETIRLVTGNVVTGVLLTLLLTIGVAPMKIFLERVP